MKSLLFQIVFFSYFFLSFSAIQLEAQKSAVVNVSVEIGEPLTVELLSDASFDTIAVNSDGGTIAFDPEDNIVLAGGLMYLDSEDNSVQTSFQVSGLPETGIKIELPKEIVLLHPDGHEIVVENLDPDSGLNPVLDDQGNLDFLLHGSLNLDAFQESGFYKGKFQVTITYQ